MAIPTAIININYHFLQDLIKWHRPGLNHNHLLIVMDYIPLCNKFNLTLLVNSTIYTKEYILSNKIYDTIIKNEENYKIINLCLKSNIYKI